ncbi:protein of unknown function [Magnetospirillum gryphiswaldense MSR-1 v2]|uniref:Uncharacterized protein n=1 Tax=Magnetospirillum gryphiswaldense (strain DSM 6361 / JCM 21280 / NBRC 15271 / MSR-1) TaxID=431944 RepID=V6F1G9_MAGGM|nr:protein of unknown function [Magnetospirillum gryphiswaldense MSR-1 v2]
MEMVIRTPPGPALSAGAWAKAGTDSEKTAAMIVNRLVDMGFPHRFDVWTSLHQPYGSIKAFYR